MTQIRVDEYDFRVTVNPYADETCLLWICNNRRAGGNYEALGRFSRFEKRKILEFITRYTTSAELRREVGRRRFEARVHGLSIASVERLDGMPPWKREIAYRSLFNLDSLMDSPPLEVKRRIMAQRFHPDAGGTNRCMVVINEAYEVLQGGRGR